MCDSPSVVKSAITIESDNPKYDITKEKVKKLAKEIVAVRKKATETKGKGKRKMILSDS